VCEVRRILFDISIRLHFVHPLICPISEIVLAGLHDSFCEIHMPFMPYRSLAHIIDGMAPPHARPAYWNPTHQATSIVTIVAFLDNLHSHGMTHGNVSLKSFLVRDDGLACGYGFLGPGMEGPARYQASESLEKSLEADIFALGIVLYEIVTGHRAFECAGREARGRIDRGEMPPLSDLPSIRMRRVIRNCWAKQCTTAVILEVFGGWYFEILPGADGEKVGRIYATVSSRPLALQ
jgi:serine/threonine protein kinase